MPKRGKPEQFAPLGKKTTWNIYSLQDLSPANFARVVGKVLNGHYTLIDSPVDGGIVLGPGCIDTTTVRSPSPDTKKYSPELV